MFTRRKTFDDVSRIWDTFLKLKRTEEKLKDKVEISLYHPKVS